MQYLYLYLKESWKNLTARPLFIEQWLQNFENGWYTGWDKILQTFGTTFGL